MEASSAAKFASSLRRRTRRRYKNPRQTSSRHITVSSRVQRRQVENSNADDKSPQQTFTAVTMQLTIAFVLSLAAIATAAPYVPVVVPVVPAVVHHPASVVHSSTVVQSHPSPPVVARLVAHPVAVHPAVAVHPIAVHPAVSVHPVAVHPVLPVHSVVHY